MSQKDQRKQTISHRHCRPEITQEAVDVARFFFSVGISHVNKLNIFSGVLRVRFKKF